MTSRSLPDCPSCDYLDECIQSIFASIGRKICVVDNELLFALSLQQIYVPVLSIHLAFFILQKNHRQKQMTFYCLYSLHVVGELAFFLRNLIQPAKTWSDPPAS